VTRVKNLFLAASPLVLEAKRSFSVRRAREKTSGSQGKLTLGEEQTFIYNQ